MNRNSRAYTLWARFYQRVWGGMKRMLLSDTTKLHSILRGPGRGIRMYLNPALAGVRVIVGRYEPPLMRWMKRTIRPGNVVFDIGSNDGHEALIAAKLVGPTGRVFAFEPLDEVRALLHRNVDANPELAPRITILPFMVGKTHDPANGIVCLDALLREGTVPMPDVIKMDVEGAECDVLEGMKEIAARRCPQSFVECHVGKHIEEAVRAYFLRYGMNMARSETSFFETSRYGFNSWTWTLPAEARRT
jgi:Methyltransferase FkbM domain